MATNVAIHWQDYPVVTGYLAAELNSLAHEDRKLGAAIDNTSSGSRFMDIEITIAEQALARSGGAYVALYILPSVDGTNYCYGDDSLDPPASAIAATVPLDATVTARVVTAMHILLPAGKFKILLKNKTGQTLAAASNTLKYSIYSEAATATPV